MILEEEQYLAHYGILRKSGRYPWGSGETQSARNRSFLDTVATLEKQGKTQKEIVVGLGIVDERGKPSVIKLRALKSIAINQQKQENIATAQKLKETGMSTSAIGREMGINESSVRNLLAPGAAERAAILMSTADMLKREVEEKHFIDVGAYVENQVGISKTRLNNAVAMLEEEGYKKHYIKVPYLGTRHETTYQVLSKEGVPWVEAKAAVLEGRLGQIQQRTVDRGRNFLGLQPPIQVSSSRIGINYKEDGGAKADGVIYVRPGAKDLDMGHNQYAQVRIAVDGSHYLKGMAVYKDGLPDGVDLQFNTNKSNTGNKLDAMKPLKTDKDGKIDQDNPFGAVVNQLPKLDAHGNPIDGTVRSALNLVNKEGDWDKWNKTLSTQFLSKQSPALAKEQLDLKFEQKSAELKQILALTNPAVKRKLLESFADDADSSAVHLKAMHLPRQKSQVIMPINSLKDNEIYAPNFRPGERVVLVRHPHGGTFEIPELTVNNKNREGIALLGKQAKDAVGINSKVAEHLSGADFDGDTVLVIPNNSGKVRVSRALEGLKHFDPQSEYKAYDGMKTIDGGTWNAAKREVEYHGKKPTGQTKQNQMGLVSNLITDMTIKRASQDELAAAVRHSMVIIDAEKHHLDYRKSARDNRISALSKKYQDGKSQGGSSTLISQAKSKMVEVPKRRPRPAAEGGGIDRATGKRMYVPTGESYIAKKGPHAGEVVFPTQKVHKILEAKSAIELSSGTPIEKIYADHSDRMQRMADQARKVYINTKGLPQSPSAKATYAKEVRSLNAKLDLALQNAPRERQAQAFANATVALKKQAYPDMDKADLKKIEGQALAEARTRFGAKKHRIGSEDNPITESEWNAIQAGAISNHRLEQMLSNADLDRVKELATPRVNPVMSSIMTSRANSMFASGYPPQEIADALGVSLSTLNSTLNPTE